jgi:betaine-aldehyde dehydrogenase
LFINGEWVSPSGTDVCNVISASTEQVMGAIPLGDQQDVDKAVAAASKALEAWSSLPPAKRADYLRRVASGLKERAEELARIITGEVGMPIAYSRIIQVNGPILQWERAADLIEKYELEEQVANSLVGREPVGVVAAITPWNYPLHQITLKVAAALAAGCTVILKPSEVAPLNAFVLAEVIDKAGLPPGVFNLVSGYGNTVGEALTEHKLVDMVSFTGSTAAGKRVAERGAATLKRTSLELGGKSASILLDDANFAKAIKGTLNGCFLNSGQTCSALTRMLVPSGRYDEVKVMIRELVSGYVPGDPFLETTRLGPLISDVQRERVLAYIRAGMEEGGELICGGVDRPEGLDAGYYVKPTVFGRVAPHAKIAQEEIFGPVLAIICYDDIDDAVRIANDSPYGLSGAVWSADQSRAIEVARRLRTGQVTVNGGAFNALAPFGGFKQSGYGREGGKFGIEEFLEYRSLQLPA